MIFMIHNIILTCSIISNSITCAVCLTTILNRYNNDTDFLFGLPLYLISRILVALTFGLINHRRWPRSSTFKWLSGTGATPLFSPRV